MMITQIALAVLLGAVMFLGFVVLFVAGLGTAFIWYLALRVHGQHHRREALKKLAQTYPAIPNAYVSNGRPLPTVTVERIGGKSNE